MTTTQFHTETTLKHFDEFSRLVADGALVVVNHSGGKDSQAAYAVISRLVPADQLVVLHADLGEVEWTGVKDHIAATISSPLYVCQAIWRDGRGKTLLDAIEARGKWPSSAARYCTSDLKRTPCEKEIRRLSKETGRTKIVSVFGFRAEESAARAKRPTWSLNKKGSVAGREWYDFNPIHDLSTAEVFEIIAAAGQEPHAAYADGNERLSCVFCVFGCAGDLAHGARKRPDLFRRYVELERKMGHTFKSGQTLEEAAGVTLEEIEAAAADDAASDQDGDGEAAAADPVEVLSFGGGVDSTALLAMGLNRDKTCEILGIDRATLDRALPAFDAVTAADPGAEFDHTRDNFRVAAEQCAAAGIPFTIVAKGGETILDWMARLGNVPVLPGASHVCSLKFKAEVLHKWAERQWPDRAFSWSIGIEAGENHRRFTAAPGARHACRHPLVELGLTRADCERLLTALGWPIAVGKSSCFFCPFQSEDELRDLYATRPALWRELEAIEDRFRVTSAKKHAAWLAGVAAGTTDPDKRAPVGQWRRDAWKEGGRLIAKSIDGRRLSIKQWAARFAAAGIDQVDDQAAARRAAA